jgi:hypothetical protein
MARFAHARGSAGQRLRESEVPENRLTMASGRQRFLQHKVRTLNGFKL